MIMRFKIWLCCKLLGIAETMEKETFKVYNDIWPKHSDSKERNLIVIKRGLVRVFLRRNDSSFDNREYKLRD